MNRIVRLRLLALVLPLALLAPASGAAAELRVFAAASLAGAFPAVAEAWTGAGNPPVRFAFAASSTLARQIEQGARAAIFVSADEAWMDHLAERGLILPETRRSALGNTLVLVVPQASAQGKVKLARGLDLAALAGPRGRIATADPSHVPLGRHAQRALEALGLWEAAAQRLVRADTPRAALLFVERGDAPLGIVYGTDARASARVRVIAAFPPESHPPIAYAFALTRAGATAEARAFLAFATGPEAAPLWRRFGFAVVD